MIPSLLSRLVILLFGTLYPAYSSYKAVRTKNVKEYVKWMMYWIVYALFTCTETFTDIFFSFWFPFYYELKIILVVYLLSPATNGSSILYRKFVHPMLTKKEQEIDDYIAKAMEQGYHTMLKLGSRGVAYATSVIMQTAIRGGGGLVNQIRKSYSLDDMNTREARSRKRRDSDEVDAEEEDDRQKVRRKKTHSPRRTVSSSSQVDLYFSEVEEYKRSSMPINHEKLSHIRSSEDISSGYSSTEPLYTGAKYGSKDNVLQNSGPSTRTRTRMAKKTSKDESGCSTTEPDESQYETGDGHPYPPISITSFVKPEYQYLFANLTQQQIQTFISNANSSQDSVKPPPSTLLHSIMVPNDGRSGKYNKKPAPVPPDKTEEEFRTPDSSPVLLRREVSEEKTPEKVVEKPLEEETPKTANEEKQEKPPVVAERENKTEEKKKSKGKGSESQITKMLHLSKIQFPFWNQKGGKNSPVPSECSSVSGISRNNSHVSLAESYISLKSEETAQEQIMPVTNYASTTPKPRRSIKNKE